jgi:hypothetical protein
VSLEDLSTASAALLVRAGELSFHSRELVSALLRVEEAGRKPLRPTIRFQSQPHRRTRPGRDRPDHAPRRGAFEIVGADSAGPGSRSTRTLATRRPSMAMTV